MGYKLAPNQLALLVCLAAVAGVATSVAAQTNVAAWQPAHATFYGGSSGNDGTMGGACGYGDMWAQGFGLHTAALSTVLFNSGLTCGACYELQCYNDPQWCKQGSVVVTATNECPPNWNKPSDNGGWCNPPRAHFDLSIPAYMQIGTYVAGIVPVMYRRVPCQRQGGVRFLVKGNPYFQMVLVYNVGCAGEVTNVAVKGTYTVWMNAWRNWGQNWQFAGNLVGQSVSFVVSTSDGATITSYDAMPSQWGYSQTFEGSQFTCDGQNA